MPKARPERRPLRVADLTVGWVIWVLLLVLFGFLAFQAWAGWIIHDDYGAWVDSSGLAHCERAYPAFLCAELQRSQQASLGGFGIWMTAFLGAGVGLTRSTLNSRIRSVDNSTG